MKVPVPPALAGNGAERFKDISLSSASFTGVPMAAFVSTPFATRQRLTSHSSNSVPLRRSDCGRGRNRPASGEMWDGLSHALKHRGVDARSSSVTLSSLASQLKAD